MKYRIYFRMFLLWAIAALAREAGMGGEAKKMTGGYIRIGANLMKSAKLKYILAVFVLLFSVTVQAAPTSYMGDINATGDAITGVAKIPAMFPIIATVGVATVFIGIILVRFILIHRR